MKLSSNIHRYLIILIGVLYNASTSFSQGSEAELKQVIEKVEQDALDFARELERVFAEEVRCSSTTLKECDNSQYQECNSLLPYTECVDSPELAREECLSPSGGMKCAARYDFSTTTVRLAPFIEMTSDGNPIDIEPREALCYSKQAEDYLVNKYESEKAYWQIYGVLPPTRYFGAENGVFRIYPAKISSDSMCGNYDTTNRPWYVAATSGPKDIILILDFSGSMNQRGRIDLMREASDRVLDTLSVADHVGVVTFSDEAHMLHDVMVQATVENIQTLKSLIKSLEPDGGTNFLAAFNLAFDLLESSMKKEASSGCTSALLFLSDGEMTVPLFVNASQVANSINQRTLEAQIYPLIFLYGLGADSLTEKAVNDLKHISCETGGMWTHVDDGGDLAQSMASYYKRFALGLAEGLNENFVAWVEPYIYADGYTVGTTASAPVFDKSVTPPVLVGAVGLSIPMLVMDKALGVAAGSLETLKKLADHSTAFCPSINVTNCVLQSLRLESGLQDALCEGECDSFVGIRTKTCSNQPDLPVQFWDNSDMKFKPFTERACCAVGEIKQNGVFLDSEFEEATHQCISITQQQVAEQGTSNNRAKPGLTNGAKIGIWVALTILVSGVMFFSIKYWGLKVRHNEHVGHLMERPPPTAPTQ